MLRSGAALNVLLLVVVVMCALSVVTSQHKGRKLFIELQKGKELTQQMEVEWGQLQLEQGTLAAPGRVEKIALRQLQMQLPRGEQIRFIRLNRPAPQVSGTGAQSIAPNLEKRSNNGTGQTS